jgi:ATP-dependent RNA helicase RhlB
MTDSIKKFTDFQLHPTLIKAIEAMGYNSCTPIQARCLPILLKGQDIAGLAQTGTGKTAAFLIPMIDRILRSQEKNEELPDRVFKEWQDSNFILILVPTRELVTQVLDNLHQLTAGSGLTSIFLYGGVGYDEQKASLKKPYQFLVATPGRLLDLYKEGLVDFKQVRAMIFDEADRMFDMGFQQDVFFILNRVPKERQLLMFSATLNFQVTEMAYEAHSNPVEIDVSRDKVTTENIEDFIIHLGKDEKPKYLLSIFKKYNPQQVIIFSNFKNKVNRVADFLTENGYPALGISSLMTQVQRNRVIERFKSENKHNIMVATDLAARGLDIKGVDLVINYELPEDAENYVHRIGRTGRAEQKGMAISFVSDRDVESLVRIEEYLKEKLDTIWLDDADFVTDFKPLPPEDFYRPRFDKGAPPDRGGPRRNSSDGRRPRRDDGPRRDNNGPRQEGGARRDSGPRRDGPNRDRPRRERPPRTDAPQGDHNPMEATGPDHEMPEFERPNNDRSSGDRSSGGAVHRDRKMGRHQNSNRNPNRPDHPRRQDGSPDRSQDRNQNRNQAGGKKRFDNRNDRNAKKPFNSRPAAKGTSTKASGSLWGKISSKIKQLVGTR